MNQSPETVEQRLQAIETTLAKLHNDHTQVLEVFRETNERYRRELDEYSSERASRNIAVNIGSVLRIAAVALLAYIAIKQS